MDFSLVDGNQALEILNAVFNVSSVSSFITIDGQEKRFVISDENDCSLVLYEDDQVSVFISIEKL